MTDRPPGADWSAADAHGIRTCVLAGRATSTLGGRRLRRAEHPGRAGPLQAWPSEWRELLATWLRRGERPRWTTLLRDAGNARYATAVQCRDELLLHGWIEIDERRERGQWHCVAVAFLDADALRAALGLPRRSDTDARLASLRQAPPRDPRLQAAFATLLDAGSVRSASVIARAELLQRLDDWLAAGRHGTRRDFEQHARGRTKSITSSEWDWLEAQIDLGDCAISRHLPALWLRAPLSLHLAHGRLDLGALADPLALTPATLAAAQRASGTIGCWWIIENRTSFERLAADRGDRDGVLWLPGFAPGWWNDAVGALLRLAPAPARVACDPDPSGIAIALGAGVVWQAHGLAWAPSAMGIDDLRRLPALPLSAHDIARLDTLRAQPLPPMLAALADAMHGERRKGEQEGLPPDAFV